MEPKKKYRRYNYNDGDSEDLSMKWSAVLNQLHSLPPPPKSIFLSPSSLQLLETEPQ